MKTVKLVLVAIAIMFAVQSVSSQEYKQVGNKLVRIDSVKAKSKSIKTTMIVEIKGIKYNVWKGSRGGYYIWRTSKKSGKKYKQYLKVKK